MKKRKWPIILICIFAALIGAVLSGVIFFYYVGFGEQDEKNETKKEVFSGVGEALEISKNGSFYQCGLEIPLEADGNIWGMSKEEFEEYTNISLVDYEPYEANGIEFLMYDISFLKGSVEGTEFHLDEGESLAIFTADGGLVVIGYEAWPTGQDSSVNLMEKLQEHIIPQLNLEETSNRYYGNDGSTGIIAYGSEGANVCLYSEKFVNSLNEQQKELFGLKM